MALSFHTLEVHFLVRCCGLLAVSLYIYCRAFSCSVLRQLVGSVLLSLRLHRPAVPGIVDKLLTNLPIMFCLRPQQVGLRPQQGWPLLLVCLPLQQ